jgi:hypothetical protein
MKTIANILIALGFFAVAGVMYLGVLEAKTFIKNQARHDCAQDYRLEYSDANTNTTVVKPIDDLYQQCLSEKSL